MLTVARKVGSEVAGAMIASLFEQHQRAIQGYLARLVEDRAWAEELAQETFFAALRAGDRLPGIANRRAWLYRMATNTAFRSIRRRRRFAWLQWRTVADRHLQERAPTRAVEQQAGVGRALAALPAEQRAPLLLYGHYGLSVAEVAEVFGISEGEARARLYRARLLFRQAHEQEMQDDGHAEIRELLAVYDSLGEEQRIELNAHLVGCAECTQELAAYRRMDRVLRNLRDPSPSSRLQAMLQAAAAPEQPAVLSQASPPTRRAASQQATTPLPVREPESFPGPLTEPDISRPWQRLLLPLVMTLLFIASLWIGMRGGDRPVRNRVVVEPPVAVITDTLEDRALPFPPTEAPLTIDARGHVTITFACSEHVVTSPEYQTLAQSFQAQNPDVTIQMMTREQAQREWHARTETLLGGYRMDMMRALAAGSDVFCADGVARQLLQEGLVRNLTPFARADAEFAMDQFYPAVLQHVTHSGSLYLIPARFHPTLIRYDPAAFEAAGLRAPRPGWSWDDLLGAAAALTLRDGANTRRWGFGETDNAALMLARFWSAVGTSQPAARLATGDPFSNTEVLDLFHWNHELYLRTRAARIPPGLARSGVDTRPPSAKEEQARRGLFAMWTDELDRTPPEGARAVPFPVSRAFDKTTPIDGIDGWAISSEAMHVDAAWRWISFISRNLPANGEGFYVPARRSVPQLQAFWNSIDPQDRESYQYALEHLGNWPLLSEVDGSYRLWTTLLSMIRGETTLAALTAPDSARAARTIEPSQIITLTFAASRDQQADYEHAASAFSEANPGTRIRVVPSEDLLLSRSGIEPLWTQMRVMAGRVDAMVNPQVAALVRSGRAPGILYDLTSMVSESLRSADYYPNTMEGLQWRGRALALPGRIGLQLIHYNEWMFDQMDVAYPQPGWTWSDFDRTVRAVALRANSTSSWWGLSERIGNGLQLLKSRTGPLVDYTTSPPTAQLDGSSAVEGAAWYARLLTDGIIAPADAWASEAAMWIGLADLEGLGDLRKAGIGVAPFPIGPGSTATTPLEPYDAFAISADTAHPKEAWQWLLYLQMHPPGRGLRDRGLSARRDGNDTMRLWEDDKLRAVIEYALEHTQRLAPLRPEEYLVTQQLIAALERIVEDGQEGPAAMKQAQAAAQEDLGWR